jgi:hypothetical protein
VRQALARLEKRGLIERLKGQDSFVRLSPLPPSAVPDLPYAHASIRHIVGTDNGGGYEWHAEGQAVPRGAAALELSQDGKITKFTAVWDGSRLDDTTITAAAAGE